MHFLNSCVSQHQLITQQKIMPLNSTDRIKHDFSQTLGKCIFINFKVQPKIEVTLDACDTCIFSTVQWFGVLRIDLPSRISSCGENV